MIKSVTVSALLAVSVVAALPAYAQTIPNPSNAVLFNATLGTNPDQLFNQALDNAFGNTNPVFDLVRGQSLLFGVSASGTFPDFLTASFNGGFFTIGDPNVMGTVIYPISTQGGNNYRQVLTFDTTGSFAGTIGLNLLVANPDYSFDGSTGPASVRREAPVFDFRVNVVDAVSAVPEPGTWSMMLLGFGAIGSAMRRRAKVTTRVSFSG